MELAQALHRGTRELEPAKEDALCSITKGGRRRLQPYREHCRDPGCAAIQVDARIAQCGFACPDSKDKGRKPRIPHIKTTVPSTWL